MHFTRSFYKILTCNSFNHPLILLIFSDRALTLSDLEEIDQSLYTSLLWMLDNDVEGLFQTFSYEIDLLGERHTVDLVPGGSLYLLTNSNKRLYVKLLALAKMQDEVYPEIQAFMKGFSEVFPLEKMQNFTPGEFESIVAGASMVDVEDMKKNTGFDARFTEKYRGWLWDILGGFSQPELSAFLYFVTGSTKVPYGGFKQHKLSIAWAGQTNKLPVAHTW